MQGVDSPERQRVRGGRQPDGGHARMLEAQSHSTGHEVHRHAQARSPLSFDPVPPRGTTRQGRDGAGQRPSVHRTEPPAARPLSRAAADRQAARCGQPAWRRHADRQPTPRHRRKPPPVAASEPGRGNRQWTNRRRRTRRQSGPARCGLGDPLPAQRAPQRGTGSRWGCHNGNPAARRADTRDRGGAGADTAHTGPAPWTREPNRRAASRCCR